MRTTSFCKAARTAALWCCVAIGIAMAQPSDNGPMVISASKSEAVDDASPVQDLGLSEVSALTESGVVATGTDYVEILPSAWEGRGLSAAEVLSALSGVQSYMQGGMGSF